MCSGAKGEMRKGTGGNYRIRRREAMFTLSTGLIPTKQCTRRSMCRISRTTSMDFFPLHRLDCRFFLIFQNQQLQSTEGHHHHDPHSGLGIASNTGFAYQQHPIANQYGIQDPILQDQPLLPAINQYEVKRENEGQLPSNPFLIDRRRQPKSIVVTMKRLDNNDYGRKGWVPIPYPLYK